MMTKRRNLGYRFEIKTGFVVCFYFEEKPLIWNFSRNIAD
jgi:hypothetical protein